MNHPNISANGQLLLPVGYGLCPHHLLRSPYSIGFAVRHSVAVIAGEFGLMEPRNINHRNLCLIFLIFLIFQ